MLALDRRAVATREDVVEAIAHAVDFDARRAAGVARWLFDENHVRHLEGLRLVDMPARCQKCFNEIRLNAMVVSQVVVAAPGMNHATVVRAPMFVTFPTDLPPEVLDCIAGDARRDRGGVPSATWIRRFSAPVGYHAFQNHCPCCAHPVSDTDLFSRRGPFARRDATDAVFEPVIEAGVQIHCGLMLVADVSEALAGRPAQTADTRVATP